MSGVHGKEPNGSGFLGRRGRESAGIVDRIAIRKNHATANGHFKRGDLFEIILIQIKGGGARWRNADDIRRLRAVAKRYNARDVLLAAWVNVREPTAGRLLAGRCQEAQTFL
jgi:hypothetical protein